MTITVTGDRSQQSRLVSARCRRSRRRSFRNWSSSIRGCMRATHVAASYGARVMAAEEYRVGGTCVIRGCPRKAGLSTRRDFPTNLKIRLVTAGQSRSNVSLVDADCRQRSRDCTAGSCAYAATLERYNVALVGSRAVLRGRSYCSSSRSVQACGENDLDLTRASAAYGTEAIPGWHAISSNEAFRSPELPRRIVVQGGGYVLPSTWLVLTGSAARSH